jgi:hypothetical protein
MLGKNGIFRGKSFEKSFFQESPRNFPWKVIFPGTKMYEKSAQLSRLTFDLPEERRHVLVVEGQRSAEQGVQDDAARPGVDVMITIFCDFCQFSAKKSAFFFNTNVMSNFFQNLALF